MPYCVQITQLKIDNNPFAKGFRDNGMGRRDTRFIPKRPLFSDHKPDMNTSTGGTSSPTQSCTCTSFMH